MRNVMSLVRDAIRERHNDEAIQLLEDNPELINQLTIADGTLLHDAVRFENEEIAQFLLDKGIDTSIESSASGMYGTAINCANTITMASLLLRNGMRPSLCVGDKIDDRMKNPVFKKFYNENDVMFEFWFDFEMQILTGRDKEIFLQVVREKLESYGKEDLLKFVDSFEDRMCCLEHFEEQLSIIMNNVIIELSKENIYSCSITYDPNINAIWLIANTKDELAKHVEKDYFYYKYCEEEWEIWNIKEKELSDLLLRTDEKLKNITMLPVYRYEILNSSINVLKKIRNNQKNSKWLFNVYIREYFAEEEMKAIYSYINGSDAQEFCEHIEEFA
ncbi:MAG: DUF4303 domain-containing protein [Lachnospiraceae bacterium]|nr:DUF4303 domain-containing protein [Lachnospiraceae bacterium]